MITVSFRTNPLQVTKRFPSRRFEAGIVPKLQREIKLNLSKDGST